MKISGLGRAVVGLALALGALLPTSTAALASCAPAPPLEQHLARADVVFVGTVRGVDDTGLRAIVDVEELWRGIDLPSVVTLQGGSSSGGRSSVDRSYAVGVRYVFAPSIIDGALVDDACSATQAYGPFVSGQRPANARPPNDEDRQVFPFGVATLALVAGVIVAAGVSVLAGVSLVLRRQPAR